MFFVCAAMAVYCLKFYLAVNSTTICAMRYAPETLDLRAFRLPWCRTRASLLIWLRLVGYV